MIVGDKDEKFKSISRKMQDAMSEGVVDAAPCKVFIVPRCGHAAHLEAPESVVARVLEAIDAQQ
jgi:pimeloyl-ACP methyl ester carboxylesterase